MSRIVRLFAATLALCLAAVSASAAEATLQVTLAYRERIALPPDAVAELQLLDVSRADAPAQVLAMQRFRMTRVPQDFVLPYDPSAIDARHSYTVAARILTGNRVLFRTTSAYPVLTRGAGTKVELLAQMSKDKAAAPSPAGIAGVEWAVTEIGGRALVADDPPTLHLDDKGSFGLFGGCNRFTGKVAVKAGQAGRGDLRFPPNFAGTMRACVPPRDKLEKDMLAALARVTGYLREGRRLSLTDAQGLVVLRLVERPE